MASKKIAIKKSTAMVSMADWEKRLEDAAVEESARVKAGSGNYIGIRGKEFAYQGADLGEELDVVILDFVYTNEYYDVPFDQENPSPPACFAINKGEDELVPDEACPDKQAEDCASCDLNQWGSAERGKGKACGNRRRIAVVSVADLDKDIKDIEVAFIRVPPTSGKNFDKYYKGVTKIHRRPAYGVITRLAFDQESDSEVLTFEALGKIDNAAHMAVVSQKREECQDALMQVPDFSGYGATQKPKSKKPAKASFRKKK